MRNKGRKIKRYKGSFDTRSFRRRRIIRWVVILLVLFAASYFLAPPILDAGSRLWYSVIRGQDIDGDQSQSQSQPLPASDSQSAVEVTPSPEPTPEPTQKGDWRQVSLGELATPEQAAQTASQLAAEGVKYAVVTLKDSTGTVAYASQVPAAAGGISASPIDAAAAAKALSDAGVTPVACLWGYQDPVAARTDRTMAVSYGAEEGVLWLDNAADAGGNPWLNPYSEAANQYLEDLALEAASMGYEQVVFCGFHFPLVNSLSSASFGETGGKGQAQILSENIQRLEQALAAKDAECWFQYSAAAVLGEDLRPAGVAVSGLGMERLVVQLPADTADPAATLAACAQAVPDTQLVYRVSAAPDEALRQAADQAGYLGAVIG